MALKIVKRCNRCGHKMWQDEETGKWYCTNPKCIKYKPQPEPEPEQTEETTEE